MTHDKKNASMIIGVGTKFALGGPLSVMPSVGLHHFYTQHMQMHSKLVTCACWYSIVLVVNVCAMYTGSY